MSLLTKTIFVLALIVVVLSFKAAPPKYNVVKRRIDFPIPHYLQYYLTDTQGNIVSPWADIDIDIDLANDVLTAIIQIPKENTAKFEMIKGTPGHPLMQDTRMNKLNNKVQLRHYAIPLPLVNYGFIPMTWEQSIKEDSSGYFGDDDPIDVVDLSSKDRKIMDIVRLKILGAFCLIDEGQLDWKVFAIDALEAKQLKIEDYYDIPRQRIQEIVQWFRIYKTYDGKPENVIGFDGKIFDKRQTLEIIYDTHVEFIKILQAREPEYAARKDEFNL